MNTTTKSRRQAYGYLICAEEPIGNCETPHGMARHYAGICGNVERRFLAHCRGEGAHLTRAFVQRGIPIQLVQIWVFTDDEKSSAWEQARAWERAIKGHKQHRDFCPRCSARRRQPGAKAQAPRAATSPAQRAPAAPANLPQPLFKGRG
jgi:predicted GIY-YIG superfamily endonuclease